MTLELATRPTTRYLVCPEAREMAQKLQRLTEAGYRLDLWLFGKGWRYGHDVHARVSAKRSFLAMDAVLLSERLVRRLGAFPCANALCAVHGDSRDNSIAFPTWAEVLG